MKKLLLLLLASGFLVSSSFFAQSNDCSTATAITVTANCAAPIAGTTTGATQSIPGCAGTADDDVWYQFTATNTSVQINVTPIAGMDPVVQLFSGTCAALTSLICKDNTLSGQVETINYTGLTIGQVYRIRVYHYFAGSGTGNFTICVTNPPPAPANNNCTTATSLSVNLACVNTNGTSVGATQSMAGCAGTADDDVWYSFVATNAVQTVTVHPTSNIDLVVQVFSGTCAGLSSISCVDNTFMTEDETASLVGLTVGQTYFVRVYDWYVDNTGSFQICITGQPTAAPTNDEPCSAIQLPEVTSDCQYLSFTTTGATASLSAPTPASCAGGSAPMQGGFSASSRDVWFAITVPSTGNIQITPEPNLGGGSISDGVMALYSGPCATGGSGLTQIACSDDFNYPGAGNDMLPTIFATGLTPGATVYLRYFGYGATSGNFGLCVTTATNDACANALYICDINGYSGMTSSNYTADRPGNMFANNETAAGVNLADGTNSGGIFGQGGPWGSGSPLIDVNINNNSWIKFTASATTATLQVTVADCFVGNYPSGGIQMQIFSGTNCASFVPVSNFEESSTQFTITANGLTVGNDYYLMIDGYAGDICGYTISAQSGVQFPDIANVAPLCNGQSVTLTAPPGATSYEWQHDGSTTQSVNVSPSTTQTYFCEVTGLCGFKQLLDVTVTVNPIPTVGAGIDFSRCAGQSATLSGTGASTYSWNNGVTNGVSFIPGSTLTYTVTGTSAAGCTNTDQVVLTVNPLPIVGAGADQAVCTGLPATISGTGASTYTWNNGVTNGVSFIPAGTLNYTVTGTDGNGCTNTDVVQVTVNPLPTVSAGADIARCAGQTALLSGSGASTYSWNNGVTNNVSFTPASTLTYTVTGTNASGCINTDQVVVTVNALPVVGAGADIARCTGQTATLAGSGASTYSWNNGVTNNVAFTPSSTLTYTVTGTGANGCTNTDQVVVTVNGLPTVNAGANFSRCAGQTASLSGSGASTYTWDNGVTNGVSFTPSSTQTYIVTGTDANGCIDTDDVQITVNANPTPVVQGANEYCAGFSASLSTSTPFTAYTWSTGVSTPSTSATAANNPITVTVTDANGCVGTSAGFITTENSVITTNLSTSICAGQSTIIHGISRTTAGLYSQTFTSTTGCDSTANVTLNVNALPTVGAGNDFAICAGQSTSLSGSGANSYSWNNSVTNGTSFTPAGTLTYTVSGTDLNGCINSDQILLTMNPLPNVVITNGASTAICAGEAITLTATGATTYSWNDGTIGATLSTTPSSAGTFTVTGTALGCTSTDNIAVSINSLPSLIVAPTAQNADCNGSNGALTGVLINGAPSLIYTWTNGASATVGASQDLTNVPAGDYSLHVMDGNGCENDFGPFIVTNPSNPAAPTLSIDDDSPCQNGSVTITANHANSSALYTWSGPNGFSSTSASITINDVSSIDAGAYCVFVTVAGCDGQAACQIITIAPLPTLTLDIDDSDSTICLGTTFSINATGAQSYVWTGPDGFIQFGSPIFVPNSTTLNQGYYVVNAEDINGCSSSDSLFVAISTPPIVDANNGAGTATFCEGASISLTATGADTYSWTGPNGYISNLQNPSISPATMQNSGIYYVSGYNMYNCAGGDSVIVSIDAGTFPVAATPDTTLCPGTPIQLSASGGMNYSWNGPNNYTGTGSPLVITNTSTANSGWYILTSTNANGCIAQDSVNIVVEYNNDCIFIPTLVTPDGNGANDDWDIQGLKGFEKAEVEIYNRWGSLLYYASPYDINWDASANRGATIDNSDKVPVGTYFYIIRLNDDENTTFKGYVEVQY
ncbi:MAG: gliding motility-associated C-terminal domain-containing protein [Bacteroidota bacterium]